jgi:DNA polymerase-1
MENNGIVLDTGLLREMSLEQGQQLLRLEREIYSSVGHQFNINSPQQLGKVLFEELKLPQSRKTKSGYSTEASVMEALRGVHPIIEFILEYRRLLTIRRGGYTPILTRRAQLPGGFPPATPISKTYL